MTGDVVTPVRRLNPPSRLRRVIENFILEVWLRYNLKCVKWELEKCEEFRKQNIAAEWRGLKVKLAEKLKALGVDPEKEPTDLTKTLEVYLLIGAVAGCLLVGIMFSLYRSALKDLLGG